MGTHTLRQALNATDFLKRAEKVIPYPIEIISGNEEARLIFMGVEHTQPEKGRKLVIDIGGGSTELVIGEDFEPKLVESRRMGCVSFAQMYFPGGVISRENFQRARMAAAQKLETLTWQFRIQGWNVAMGASGTIKAAHEVLLEMGEKTVLSPRTLDKLTSEVLKHASFDALSLPGLSEERKAVFVLGSRFCAAFFDALAIRELRLSDGALREGVLYEMEGRFRHGTFAAVPPAVWRTSTTLTVNRPGAYWKQRCKCTTSGIRNSPNWPTLNWKHYCAGQRCCMRLG